MAVLWATLRFYSFGLTFVYLGLFAYVDLEDENQWEAIADTEVCQRWWAHMREIMPSNQDNSPLSEQLEEVFHLD